MYYRIQKKNKIVNIALMEVAIAIQASPAVLSNYKKLSGKFRSAMC